MNRADFHNSKSFVNYRGRDEQNDIHIEHNGLKSSWHHSRLSIINLNGSQQPINDSNYTLAFNGEIYNYLELGEKYEIDKELPLKYGDTDVLYALLCKNGVKRTLEELEGMFAFAFWDKAQQSLTLAKDRWGVKPLSYRCSEGFVSFGSDIRSLSTKTSMVQINPDAVYSFFAQGFVQPNEAIFNEVKKVAPGSYVEVNLNEFVISEVEYQINHRLLKTKKSLDELLKESLRSRLISDVPIGLYLSGGIDSGLMAYYSQKLEFNNEIESMTIGFEQASFDESGIAKLVAEKTGHKHQSYRLSEDEMSRYLRLMPVVFDEPFADMSSIPSLFLGRMASEKVKVVISADGGDEFFNGYWKHIYILRSYVVRILKDIFRGRVGLIVKRSIRYRSTAINEEYLKIQDYYKKMSCEFLNENASGKINLALPRNLRDKDAAAYLSRLDAANYMAGDILTKVDRTSMYNDLEAREPMLSSWLTNYGLNLAWSKKIRLNPWMSLNSKRVLRKHVLKSALSLIVKAPKKGFSIPLDSLIDSSLELFEVQFETDNLEKIGIYNVPLAQKIWIRYKLGEKDLATFVIRIFLFNEWFNNRVKT